jgi:hypothetical protein
MIHHHVRFARFDFLPGCDKQHRERDHRNDGPHNLAAARCRRDQRRFFDFSRCIRGSQYRDLGDDAREHGDPENSLSQWLIHL